jgi:NADPH-dependent curcumin reductase CurA
MATYTQVVLAERPTGDIIPGQTFELKQKKKIEESDLKDGQVLIETRYLSLDPAMRGWLNDRRSYVPPVPIGGVMHGAVIAKVIGSKSTKYPVGSYVYASAGWTELAVYDDSSKDLEMAEIPKEGRLTDALGVLGPYPRHPRLDRLIAESSCGKASEAIIRFLVLVIAFSCCWAICQSTQGAFVQS